MKKMITCMVMVALTASVFAQIPLTVSPSGGNKKASVSERIGITDVSIHYDRPGVKGREGKIYGTNVVPFGYQVLGFGYQQWILKITVFLYFNQKKCRS